MQYARYTPEIAVRVCGREWILTRPQELEAMWAALSDDDYGEDERIPYWVELWPASLTLSEWLGENRAAIRGKACLDLGCGLGLTALVASWLGANVLAMDYEPEALIYAKANARRNGTPQPCWAVMDWRRPAVKAGSIAFLWGGDIMYERRFVSPVLNFLDHALEPGGLALLAEPSRDVYEHFRAALVKGGWLSRCVREAKVNPLYMQPARISVKLWELRRE